MKPAETAAALWDHLWQDYRQRVPYAQIYEQMILQAGGRVVNDHIAFRSLGLQIDRPGGCLNFGINYLAPLIEALGYRAINEYTFRDQHLYARHYRHPDQERLALPKLFISELVVADLPAAVTQMIAQTVDSIPEPSPVQGLLMDGFDPDQIPQPDQRITSLARVFSRPWQPPLKSTVAAVNTVSQYGAWVLLHGYGVNHFTGYINAQNTALYANIETTAQGLAARGVPMKTAIEGSPGSGLRQTATQAVTEMVPVRDESRGEPALIPWTYAYFEIAERGWVEPMPGHREWFEGFLGPQARSLFEMTRKP